MNNLELWDKVRQVPDTAKKEIKGGRLAGKTDINPMWRIKTLTEQFGLCGFGWKYEITEQMKEEGGNGEIASFVNINLYIKYNGEWSEPIPGTGGSMFVANEKNGPYVSDECFKMALTDAISVACKALGIGADVYWEKDATKYDAPQAPKTNSNTNQGNSSTPTDKPPKNAPVTSGQPSDLERRATAIYFQCTGNKEGQLGWTKEAYKEQLKKWKEEGHISTDYGKKWLESDIIWIEATITPLPF